MRKLILITILLAVAFGLRLHKLDARGLITDEKFTLLNANGFWVGGANQSAFKKEFFTSADFWEPKVLRDYFDATANADFGTHIIHNGVIHVWMQLFGNSDYSVRLPGLIFNVLTVLLIFLMVLKYFRSYSAAFISALLFAVDPLNVAQSHIARSYPLSFFMILLSTEYFIRIIKEGGKRKDFIIYTVLVALCMLNHYINFFVPLAHIIIFMISKNKSHLWKGFICAAITNALVLIYWFTWGGGYTALDFLQHKNKIHTEIAENTSDELSNVIQKATPDLIVKRGIELFYDISVVGHGLFEHIKGVKVFIASLFIAVLLLLYFKTQKLVLKGATVFLSIITLILFKEYSIAILISAALFLAVYYAVTLMYRTYFLATEQGQFILLATGLCMLIMPILFVINDAFSNGNTTSLTHRYIGNASPFVVILFGVGIVQAVKNKYVLGILFCLVVVQQYQSIKLGIENYFSDKSLYNAFFEPPRVKNPYISAANKIKSLYQAGDTLIIPGAYKDKYQERYAQDIKITFTDAQYLNLYFDKDFPLVQTINPNEREKLFLKRKNGQQILIFDFKGEEYRY